MITAYMSMFIVYTHKYYIMLKLCVYNDNVTLIKDLGIFVAIASEKQALSYQWCPSGSP